MLNILLLGLSYYQMLGVSSLVFKQACHERLSICFLLPSDERNKDIANIIFRDDMVTVNIFNKKYICRGRGYDSANLRLPRTTINIPFISRGYSLGDVSAKIEKILNIARTDYGFFVDRARAYWLLGLKKYAQLSDTENDVMILIGQGYNSADISRILNRSPKTISTHYRNACRKIGGANLAEFYRYASFIASCEHGERETLCL